MELSSSLFSNDKINLNESDKFCLQLEELIKSWNLGLEEDDLDKERTKSTKEFIKCFDLNFKIELIENEKLKKNNLNNLLDNILNKIKEVNYLNSNDIKFIERIYGINNFILIRTDNDLDIIESERIIRLINSSISCSIINTKCIYPIFLQIKDLTYELSTGLFINFGIRIQYDSALFDLNQFNLNTLSDFLKIFENKLKRNLQIEDNVRCFLANRRYLNNYFIKLETKYETNLNILFNNNLNQELENEFKNLKLINHLKNLRFQIMHTEILPKIHGTQWIYSADELITKQFHKLENGCLNIKINYLDQSNIFKSIKFMNEFLEFKHLQNYLQLNSDQLKNLDEYKQFCNDNYNNKQNYLNYFMVNENLKNEFIDENFNLFKSTSFNSIIYRFSNYIFNLYTSKLINNNQSIDFIYKRILFEINDFWSTIVDQLRRYWELCDLIPSVEYRLPDLNSNLLTQKIQMLNCCIKEKEKRELLNHQNLDQQSEEEDDEFYDCEDNQVIDEEDHAEGEGRLEKLEFNLLNNKDRFVYKPITQDLRPYTEDNQDEYLKAYSGLNLIDNLLEENIDELLIGKNILLVSDMQAFKAANPGCCFEDFIHWYSPKDFLETKLDEQTNECVLSERFQQENCLWRKIWNLSKPLPVSRQKRLFNYSMEAERVLNYLNTIKIKELTKHLFSTIVQIGCLKYKQIIDNFKFKSNELIDYFDEQIKKIVNRIKNNDNIDDLLIELDNEIFQYLGLIYLFERTEFNSEFYNNSIDYTIDNNKNSDEILINTIEKSNLNIKNLSLNNLSNNQLNDKQLKLLINELTKNKFFKINKTDNLIVFNGLNRMFNLDNFKQLKEYENRMNLNTNLNRNLNTNLNTNLNRNNFLNQCLDKEYTFIADCTRPEKYSRKLPQKLNFIVRSNLENRKYKIQMNGQYAEDNVYF